MRKAEWYLRGFESFGWRYRVVASLGRLMLKLRLIDEQQAKDLGNTLINNYLMRC